MFSLSQACTRAHTHVHTHHITSKHSTTPHSPLCHQQTSIATEIICWWNQGKKKYKRTRRRKKSPPENPHASYTPYHWIKNRPPITLKPYIFPFRENEINIDIDSTFFISCSSDTDDDRTNVIEQINFHHTLQEAWTGHKHKRPW